MAAHAHRHPALDLPQPLRAAAPLAVLALLALAFEAEPALRLAGGAAALCFAAAAVVRWLRERLALQAVRRTADRLIVQEPCANDAPELVRWRTEELTAVEARDALRHEFERLLRDLDPRTLPSASPLRRPAARANEELLRRIAARVGSGRPVNARGIVLAQRLLHEAGSPLYAEDAEPLLSHTLSRILGALEP